MHLRRGIVAGLGLCALAVAGAPAVSAAAPAAAERAGNVYVNDNTAGTSTIGAFARAADGTLAPLAGSPLDTLILGGDREEAAQAAQSMRCGPQDARGLPAMNCRQVVELIKEYLEGTLSAADCARFEEHIAGCDGCRAYLAQLRITRRVVGKLADEAIPEPIEKELLKAFRDWRSTSEG